MTTWRDISEKLEMEQQLLRGQKLEAVGQLAAGIAHEINTPTQYVGDNIRFLKESFAEVGALLQHLKELSQNPRRRHPSGRHRQGRRRRCRSSARRNTHRHQPVTDGASRRHRPAIGLHPATERTPLDINRAMASTATVAQEWKYVAEPVTDFRSRPAPGPVSPGD
ncbi:MAG: hypothetical protein R3F27_12430 [Gammaproteobacteria bacterium]